MKRRFSDVESPVHLYESSGEKRALHTTSDGGIEERDTTQCTSDGGMENERDKILHTTSEEGIEKEINATLHTTRDEWMKEERDTTLCTSDGGMKVERDKTLHMTRGEEMEKEVDAPKHTTRNEWMKEERNTNLYKTSDERMKEEQDVTLHTTRDKWMKEETDTNLHTTRDKWMKEERDTTLCTSDGGMEKERDTNLHTTRDLAMEKETDTALHTTRDKWMKEERNTTLCTNDGGMEKERDMNLHTTSDEGTKKEVEATLHMTRDEWMKEERDTNQCTSEGGIEDKRETILYTTSDGGMEEARETTLHKTSDRGMEEERDAAIHRASDLGLEEEIDTTLHTTSDNGMEKERDATLHMTRDEWVKEEGDKILHTTSDGGMEEERDTTLNTTSDEGMDKERNTTLHTTSDEGMEKEVGTAIHTTRDEWMKEMKDETDTVLYTTSDGRMEKKRDTTLHTRSDDRMKEERDINQCTSDGGMEDERDTILYTSDGGIEKERDTILHVTSNGGIETEREASLLKTSDGGTEEERDATLHTTSDGEKEEEIDTTLHKTSDGEMEEEIDATLHKTSDGEMEEEIDATLHKTSDGEMEKEIDATLHKTSDGEMEEERDMTLHTTSNEWIEKERSLGGDAELEEEFSDEASEMEDNMELDPDYHSSDGEESEDEPEELEVNANTEEAYLSKNKKIQWTSTPQRQRGRFPAHRIIKMTPGPTRMACAHAEDIRSTFELYFPNDIKETMIKMTNLEGKRVCGAAWKRLDWIDLQAFLGLLILAGVYRSHHEAINSLWHGVSGRAIFRATMPLSTFTKLSRIFCFYKRDEEQSLRKTDKLAPVRNIWEKWVERLPLLYNPGPNVTVDECLVRFRGQCPFKQYMPSKPGKYGIKIWAACDSRSSYAWNMQIYTGKAADGKSEKNQGMRVVLDMTEGLMGHTITCDNFFTSYALGEELLRRKMTMIGTVRSNKPELPPALLSMKDRARTSSKFAFNDTHTVVSYCPRKKKNVLLMSTFHKDDKVSDKEHKKPEIILDYNHTKGGVDNLDKLVATYTCQRKTTRWPMVVFFNMLDVSAYNAFVLWTEINPSWNKGKNTKRRLFLEELGEALVAPFMASRHHVPRSPASHSMVILAQAGCSKNEAASMVASKYKVMEARAYSSPAKTNNSSPVSTPSKRKRCQVCESKKSTKTRLTCSQCNMFICKSHAIITSYCYACKKV